MSFWSKLWNGIKSIGKAFVNLVSGKLGDMVKNLTEGLADFLAPAIQAFKFAKAAVTGDLEGMKEAAIGLAMEFGGSEIMAAFNACKCLVNGDILGATKFALQAGLGDSSIGSKIGTGLEMKEGYEKGGLEGLGMATLFASPLGNQAQRGMEIKQGIEEGGAGGGALAFFKTTAVGHRVDGVEKVANGFSEGGLDGGLDAGLEVSSGYGRSVFGHQADRYKNFGNNVAEDGGSGMITSFVTDRFDNSQLKSKTEDVMNFSASEYAGDLASRKADEYSDQASGKFTQPMTNLNAADDHAEASFWDRVNAPFVKIDTMFTTAETKIDMFADAPFLKLESKISGAEDKALSMFEAPERMFRAKVLQPVDDAINHVDSKVEDLATKAEAPVVKVTSKADEKVDEGLDKITKPFDDASMQVYNAVNDPMARGGERSNASNAKDSKAGSDKTPQTQPMTGLNETSGQTRTADEQPAAQGEAKMPPIISDAALQSIVKQNSKDMPTGMAWN